MKKAIVLVLCLAMLLMLAVGCTPTTTTTGAPTGTGATTAEATTTLGPPTEVSYYYPLFGGVPVDQQKVNDAINEISLAKANVTAVLNPISIAGYNDQVNLMITGGEAIDLLVTLPGGPTLYSTMVANGQLTDITELAPQYAQGTIDSFNEINPGYLKGAYIDGKLYGFPCLFDKVSNMYISFRKDVLDANNLDLSSVKNITDLEAIVKVLSENSDIPALSAGPGNGYVLLQAPLMINFEDFSKDLTSEFFGSDIWAYGAIVGEGNSTVINFYASDYYKKGVELSHDWYNKGYIMKDSATQTEPSTNLIAANGILGTFTAGELGIETSLNNRCNHEMTTAKVANGIVNTGMVQKFVWTVPITSKHPEAALSFLNLTYTDSDILNLINYGIEGEHYVLDDQGRIKYPDGVTAQSSPYNVNASFMFGSQFAAKVWSTDPADLRDQMRAVNKSAKTSIMMGYTFNPTSILNEYTAVSNVIKQYAPGLNSGASDPALLTEFLASLDQAGMPKIIARTRSRLQLL